MIMFEITNLLNGVVTQTKGLGQYSTRNYKTTNT